jgi:hypothetical protein
MNTSLRDTTLKLLRNRPVTKTYRVIQTETGLPEGWLKSFANGQSVDPAVNRIETLYTYLSGRTIKL